MKTLIDRIGSLGYWLIPILTWIVAVAWVPATLAFSAVHPIAEMHAHPGYRRLALALLLVVMVLSVSILLITLLLNSWDWLVRCHKRRLTAQAIVGIGCVGAIGYAYINLFWPAIERDLLLLKQVRGIKVWLIAQLLAYNFLFPFIPYGLSLGRIGRMPRREYLTHVLVKDRAGRESRLSLKTDIAYFHMSSECRCVYTVHAEKPVFETGMSLRELESQVDPALYFAINRNFLVHRDAIAGWKPEPGGRRIKVWLDPQAPGSASKTGEVKPIWISKEKAPAFREWIGGMDGTVKMG